MESKKSEVQGGRTRGQKGEWEEDSPLYLFCDMTYAES